MLAAYEKLGHMKKLATPFNMSKIKARDLAMLNTTDAYKNILYENYRLEQEEIYGVYPPPPLPQPKPEREISSKSLFIDGLGSGGSRRRALHKRSNTNRGAIC